MLVVILPTVFLNLDFHLAPYQKVHLIGLAHSSGNPGNSLILEIYRVLCKKNTSTREEPLDSEYEP